MKPAQRNNSINSMDKNIIRLGLRQILKRKHNGLRFDMKVKIYASDKVHNKGFDLTTPG